MNETSEGGAAALVKAERERNARFIERYAQRLEAGPAIREHSTPINRHRYEPGEAETFRNVLNALASSVRSGIDCESDWPDHATDSQRLADHVADTPSTIWQQVGPIPSPAVYSFAPESALPVKPKRAYPSDPPNDDTSWMLPEDWYEQDRAIDAILDDCEATATTKAIAVVDVEALLKRETTIHAQMSDRLELVERDLVNAYATIGKYQAFTFIVVVLVGVFCLDWLADRLMGLVL